MSARISWRERLQLRPELIDPGNWPVPDLTTLTEAEQGRFYALVNKLRAFLGGASSAAEAAVPYTPQWLYAILDRALGGEANEEPPLGNALVKWKRLKAFTREAPLEESKGFAGAVQMLRKQHPAVFKRFDAQLDAELGGRGPNLNAHLMSSQLRGWLIADGVKATEYPFTTKGLLRETVRKYRREYRLRHLIERGRDQRNANSLMRPTVVGIGDELQFDGHLQDFESALLIARETEWQPIRVARFWLLVAAEARSTAVFGYSHGYSQQYSANDLLSCIENSMSPWEPYQDLPPGLSYPTDGGMPSQLEPLKYAIPTIVTLDNAWAHSACDVYAFLHRAWNCVINLGRPRFPIARRIVEMVFRRLAVYEHENPSTTGSTPVDPRRDDDRETAPRVHIWDIPKIVDVCVADYNAAPREDLAGASPLGVLRGAKTC